MLKIIGYALIVFGIIMGIYSTSQLFSDPWFALFMVFVFSYGIYIAGQRLRVSVFAFKRDFLKFTGAYILGIFLIPAFLFYIEEQANILKKVYKAETDFYFFTPGADTQFAVIIVVYFVLITMLGYKVFNGWRAGGHLATGFIVVLTLFFFGYQYVTFDSYRGIHKERGYVSKEWNEEEIKLSYNQIEEFRIEPFVNYGALSDPTDETEFMWRFIIVPKDGKEFVYNTQTIGGRWLSDSIAMKEKALEENIPFTVLPLDEKMMEWYVLELDLEEVDPQPYNEFFGVQ